MQLSRSSTLADFLRDASPFLMRHEAEHGLLIGVAIEVAGDPPPGIYSAIVRDDAGDVVGAALRTTDKLILARCEQSGAAALIADSALTADPAIPGVLGPTQAVEEFVAHAGGEWRDGIAHRVYECRRVAPPTDVRGTLRLARREDRDTLVRWICDFASEALGAPLDESIAAKRAESQRSAGALYVWEVDGEIVSTAAAVAPTPHGIRVGGVYTPPELRGRGYASALTAAVTARQLEMGRALVFLYTDLANPVSNRIYQRIGYVPMADVGMRLRPGASAV